jgi:uncharacterized membrane protein
MVYKSFVKFKALEEKLTFDVECVVTFFTSVLAIIVFIYTTTVRTRHYEHVVWFE